MLKKLATYFISVTAFVGLSSRNKFTILSGDSLVFSMVYKLILVFFWNLSLAFSRFATPEVVTPEVLQRVQFTHFRFHG
jgi:hypothetical protein